MLAFSNREGTLPPCRHSICNRDTVGRNMSTRDPTENVDTTRTTLFPRRWLAAPSGVKLMSTAGWLKIVPIGSLLGCLASITLDQTNPRRDGYGSHNKSPLPAPRSYFSMTALLRFELDKSDNLEQFTLIYPSANYRMRSQFHRVSHITSTIPKENAHEKDIASGPLRRVGVHTPSSRTGRDASKTRRGAEANRLFCRHLETGRDHTAHAVEFAGHAHHNRKQ